MKEHTWVWTGQMEKEQTSKEFLQEYIFILFLVSNSPHIKF